MIEDDEMDEDEALVAPSRGAVEVDWSTAILNELREFLDVVKRISSTAPSVSTYVFQRGLDRLGELERRVESMERAHTVARTMIDAAKGHLQAISRTME